MSKEKKLFTSESVTEGHPDKIADQVADSILDEVIKQDPEARVAVEATVTTGLVFVYGEMTTSAYVDVQSIVRKTVAEIGYTRGKYGFDAENLSVMVAIDEQSPDIAQGVDNSLEDAEEIGAGDQGLVFGGAVNETETLMPLPITLAHGLTKKLSEVRKKKEVDYLRPDGKSQVTVEYGEDGKPKRVDTVVVSTQHCNSVGYKELEDFVINQVIKEVIPAKYIDKDTKYLVNPTGKFVIGGPKGDSGVVGRKIIVDTYGGYFRHGGGAFSSKDPSKVDRSATYMARYIAKNIVAAGYADKCEVQLAYAIGVANPVSVMVDTFGTGTVSESELIKAIRKVFKLTPKGIIEQLDLLRPIYKQTAAYGHFGRELQDFTWEKKDKVEELQDLLG